MGTERFLRVLAESALAHVKDIAKIQKKLSTS